MSPFVIAALYVAKDGCYSGVDGVDPWPIERDARSYAGPWPIVAHPPCQRWGRFWHGSTRKPHQFKKGDDGGCFAAALDAVRRHGGVIEHPADSHAWAHFNLNAPPRSGGWIAADMMGGVDLPCRAGPLRPFLAQANLALRSRMQTSRIDLGTRRATTAPDRARAARLREGAPHRHGGHDRRQAENRNPRGDATPFSRLAHIDCSHRCGASLGGRRMTPTFDLPAVRARILSRGDRSAHDGEILALWGKKKDTRDIAAALNMREADVANRLARLRDREAELRDVMKGDRQ